MISKNFTKIYKGGFTRTPKTLVSGFTLMETLIAILVLSLAIVGPLTIAQKGLQSALIAKDQVTAYYLAQDAVEYVRWARDTNCLTATLGASACPASSWFSGSVVLTPCVSASGSSACYMGTAPIIQPASCSSGVCPAINYDSTQNTFNYSTGSASIFTRTVSIISPVCNTGNTICNANEATVSVTVAWKDPLTHSITVKEDLLDWQ